MAEGVNGGSPALIVAVHTRMCALPLSCVIETMRPLPVEPIAGAPPFVSGVAIIRGVPTPVIDMATLLGEERGVAHRFVTLRLGERQVAISVEEVFGIRQLASTNGKLPPLLQGASHEAVAAIGTLDQQMLVVLQSGWQLPREALQAVSSWEAGQ